MSNTTTAANSQYIEKIAKAVKAATKRIDAIDDYNASEARTLRSIRGRLLECSETFTAHSDKRNVRLEMDVDAYIRDLACEGVHI